MPGTSLFALFTARKVSHSSDDQARPVDLMAQANRKARVLEHVVDYLCAGSSMSFRSNEYLDRRMKTNAVFHQDQDGRMQTPMVQLYGEVVAVRTAL
jgi:hypothetical protein